MISAGALALGLLGPALLGCSDDPTGDVAVVTTPPPHGRSPGTATSPAPPASSDASPCSEPPALANEPAAALTIRSDPPPPLGGTIAPGVYDLVEIDAYAGTGGAPFSRERSDEEPGADGEDEEPGAYDPGPSNLRRESSSLRSTVRIGDGYVVETRATGDGAVETWAARLSIEGAELVLERLCPGSGTVQRAPFTGAGEAGFAWTIEARRFVYARRP